MDIQSDLRKRLFVLNLFPLFLMIRQFITAVLNGTLSNIDYSFMGIYALMIGLIVPLLVIIGYYLFYKGNKNGLMLLNIGFYFILVEANIIIITLFLDSYSTFQNMLVLIFNLIVVIVSVYTIQLNRRYKKTA